VLNKEATCGSVLPVTASRNQHGKGKLRSEKMLEQELNILPNYMALSV